MFVEYDEGLLKVVEEGKHVVYNPRSPLMHRDSVIAHGPAADARHRMLDAAFGVLPACRVAGFPQMRRGAFEGRLSTWNGIRHIVTRMERQGSVVSLRRRVHDGWRCSGHSHAMLAADGIGTAPTPFKRCRHRPLS
jgi:hypothetical protein